MTSTVSLPSHHPNSRVERDQLVAAVMLERPGSISARSGDICVALGASFRELRVGNAVVTAADLDDATRTVVETEAIAQNANGHTDDDQEAMVAYMQRRPPVFRRR